MRPQLRRKRICVLAGGTSNEREVSLRSGRHVLSVLKEAGYDVTWVDVDGNFLNHIEVLRGFDVFYNALHGTQGEDGCVQGILECMGAKYTGENVLNSALSFHKLRAKECLFGQAVSLPKHIALSELTKQSWFNPSETRIADKKHSDRFRFVLERKNIRYPFFLKPMESGSSIGVRLVGGEQQLAQIFAELQRQNTPIESHYIEQRIGGREVTLGLYTSKGTLRILPALEVVSSNDFYDFEAKYTPGSTDLRPASDTLTRPQMETLREAAERIYRHFNYRGCVRMDFVVESVGARAVFLESNTQPGMTETSDIPKMLEEAGVGVGAFLEDQLEQALAQ